MSRMYAPQGRELIEAGVAFVVVVQEEEEDVYNENKEQEIRLCVRRSLCLVTIIIYFILYVHSICSATFRGVR